jgi:TolB-like protein
MSKDVPPSGGEGGAGPPAPAAEPAPPGLLAELRRRGVVRAVVGYGVAAFAVLQVTEPILRGLHLPEGWLTPVVVLLGLGFPVTAALSWAFDLTTRGLVRTADAAPVTPGAARSPWLAQGGVIVLAAALGAALAWLALRTPAPVADADGRISVAVADFANETRDPDLDGLSGLLITSLEQSKKLRVVTRARMIDLTRHLGREAAERIDEALAREVGRKAGVRALLVASIRRLGESYTAELKALDPEKDEYLFTLREQARTKDEILPLVDRLSERVRLGLREGAREVAASDIKVAEAITPSLEAYRHYFRGKEALARLETGAAMGAFMEAVTLEPRFALAYYDVALLGFQMGAREKHLIEMAAKSSVGAPEKERGLIRALAAYVDSRFEEGHAAVQALSDRFPDDAEVAYLASQVLYWVGDFDGELPHIARRLRLRPGDHMARMDLLVVMQAQVRQAEGLALATDIARREPTPPAIAVRGLAKALVGDLAGSVEDCQVTRGDPLSDWIFSQALAACGRFEEALGPLASVDHYFIGLARAVALAYAGRRREMSASMERSAADPAAARDQILTMLATMLAGAGDQAAARRVLPGKDQIPGVQVLAHYEVGDDGRLAATLKQLPGGALSRKLGAALLADRQGHRAAALAALRELDRPAGWFVPYYRGMLAAAEGQHLEAVEALQRFEPPMLVGDEALLHPWLQARARLQLARSLDALGRREEGRRYVELQLARWKQADPDLPLLAEARAVCRQVGCQAP